MVAPAPRRVCQVEERRRDRRDVGIAEVCVAIGERSALGLGEQVNVARRMPARRVQIERREHPRDEAGSAMPPDDGGGIDTTCRPR